VEKVNPDLVARDAKGEVYTCATKRCHCAAAKGNGGCDGASPRAGFKNPKGERPTDTRKTDEIFLSCGTKGLLLFLSAYSLCDPFDAATHVGCRSPR
jgi:hypothetical protein